ncbi:MAG: hypothetical protein AAF687_13830 [Pseudomonadota bacterium]
MKPIYAITVLASLGIALAACDETAQVGEVEGRLSTERAEDADTETSKEAKDAEAEASDKASKDDAAAAEKAEVRAFIDSIFAGYTPEGYGVDINSPAEYFDPELAAAIKAEQVSAEAAGDVPMGLDADPFCNCQDWDEFSHTIDAVTLDGDKASAKVTINNFGAKETRAISLTKTATGWRVSDLDGGFRSIFL